MSAWSTNKVIYSITVVIRVFRVGLLILSRRNSRNVIRFAVACVVGSVAKY